MNDQFMCDSNWIQESSLEETIFFLKQIARAHCQQAGPAGIEIQEFLDQSSWHKLVDYRINYGCGDNPLELAHLRQALAFFEKLNALPLGVDTEAVAFEKFKNAENECLLTNRRLRSARRGELKHPSLYRL